MKKKNKVKESDVHPAARCFLKRPARSLSKTGFKGVSKRDNRKFVVMVWRQGQTKKYLSTHDNAISAAKAYDKYVRENIGDWPFTNFLKNGKRRVVK